MQPAQVQAITMSLIQFQLLHKNKTMEGGIIPSNVHCLWPLFAFCDFPPVPCCCFGKGGSGGTVIPFWLSSRTSCHAPLYSTRSSKGEGIAYGVSSNRAPKLNKRVKEFVKIDEMRLKKLDYFIDTCCPA